MAGFKDIIGHEQIIWHLRSAIASDKISHAYLLSGEAGTGKKTIAAAFAQTVQCEKGGTEPCMECRSCKQAMSGNQPDIIWISHEKPNTISVEDVRTQVNADIMIKPYSSRYKVYIMDEADKMNAQAQNAILKTIEEPPAYAIILLLANNADSLLPTILSRCVRLNLKAVVPEKIEEYLMTKQIPDYQAKICASFSQGNVGKALKLASSDSFGEMKEEVLSLLRLADQMEIYEVIGAIKEINKYKGTIEEVLDLLELYFRDVLLFKATADVDSLLFAEELQQIRAKANSSSYEGLQEIVTAIEKARARIRANVNFDLAMELLLLTIREN